MLSSLEENFRISTRSSRLKSGSMGTRSHRLALTSGDVSMQLIVDPERRCVESPQLAILEPKAALPLGERPPSCIDMR